ncbi:MAG: ABC transporter substrate-binding protein [Desulfamplus sp.]|nr:ABC transporter substrate-binding protein [Desulfamplus sp.]
MKTSKKTIFKAVSLIMLVLLVLPIAISNNLFFEEPAREESVSIDKKSVDINKKSDGLNIIDAISNKLFSKKSDDIHIAVVCPISGSNASNGKAVIQGARLYFESVNHAGGVNGSKIILDMYDDEDDGVKAGEKALEIIKDNKAVAIIGHESSSCSISGGKIYKQHQIPAISPTSTDVKVTKDNEWYFRTTFNNDFQGLFLANYIINGFKKKTVSIIHEDLDYGANLAGIFQKTYEEIGGSVKYVWQYEMKDQNLDLRMKQYLDLRLKQIVDELKSNAENAGVIVLALHPPEGFKLIKLLRESGIKNHILFAAGLDSPEFLKKFNEYPKERSNPGYYTNDMYAASGIIFDTADENVQAFMESYHSKYNEEANRRAAFSYDAAKIIHKALLDSGITGKQSDLKDDRKKIRDYLASINTPLDAVEGVTGFTYFNENGDPSKPVSMGVFKNQKLISAPIQLQEIRDLNEIPDFEDAIRSERAIILDNKYMHKTNVVYTGMKINKLSEIDTNAMTFMSDFNIWFRYYGNIEPQKIEFLNAVEPVDIGQPVEEKITDRINYRLYHVRGRFMIDSFTDRPVFGEHVLGIGFRHQEMSRANLIYVTDILGMGLTESFGETIKNSQVLTPEYGWTISRIAFYQGISEKKSLGDPDYLNIQSGVVNYSRFNIGIRIEKVEFRIRQSIPKGLVSYLSGISMIIILSILFLGRKQTVLAKSKIFLSILAISTVFFLLSGEILLLQWLIEKIEPRHLQIVIKVFDILWWFIPAFFLGMAVELFIWIPLEKRANRSIPQLVRRCVTFIIWMLVFFGIIAFVFDQKITSLLATSGVIAMIIGLAIQINISNIFSGIAINIERPFRIGDWIIINDIDEGEVIDITWRTTRIRTRANNIISIPNSMASEAVIQNFNYPDNTYSINIRIHVDPAHPPEQVEKILLNAMLSVEDVKTAVVRFGFSNWSGEYLAIFKVENYVKMTLYRHVVSKKIWTALNQAQIVPVIHMHRKVNKV